MSDGSNVGQFVPKGNHFRVTGCFCQMGDGSSFTVMPALFFAYAFRPLFALIGHQGGDSLAKLSPDLFHGHVSVLHRIMKGGSG